MEHENDNKVEAEQHESAMHHKTHHKMRKAHKMGLGIVILLIAVIIVGGIVWLYTGKISSAKEKVFKAMPLPAAVVDMKFVSAQSIIERVDLAKQLLEAQDMGDQSDPNKTFDQIIDVKKLEAVASQKQVTATNAEIDEEYKNIVTQYAQGDEEGFKKELEATYRMTPDKFKTEVVRQQVLQSNLLLWFSKQEDLNKKAYDTAKDLQGKLNSGQSFDDVTIAYSQDEATKDFAGDSGIIPFDDLLPEFREKLKDAKVGDVTLAASRYGLHLMKVLELNNNGHEGAKQIHLQQLFIKQEGFAEWLQTQTDNIRVMKLLKFS